MAMHPVLCAFGRSKTRSGKSSEMAVWVLLQIRLELFPPIAVLHRVPESEIERVRSDLGGRPRGTRRRHCSSIKPRSGKRGEGTVRIAFEIGCKLGRAAVLNAVPKCELQGNLTVGGRFGVRLRSGNPCGWCGCIGGG